ncbi:BTAD domain-containing putative transcriptional regulator [uncultured Pseudokineococcus sp.]|uniref:BTAD domain-containing putative transcriptional regulator n=1 Tax=uncultured Pseudokineococcus sp. TaxID=1642928 RepID=UPI00262DF4B8|nr:BTAD domain-containing putative transcriptional regulator [uncultured Pseudokineococcus sp.]
MEGAADLAEGDRAAASGDGERALRCFARGAARGAHPVAVAWRTGLVHHLRGQVDEALRCYDAVDLATADPDVDVALLLGWRAAARWLGGDLDGARTDAARADEAARASGEDRALAAACTALALVAAADGDRRWNAIHHDRALRHAERAGDAVQVLRVRSNRGSRLLEEGRCAEAVAELDRALGAAEPGAAGFLEALALVNRGEATSRLGRLEEALRDLEAAAATFRRLESPLVAYALGALGDVRRLRGEVALARLAYEEALLAARGTGDAQALQPALAGLALLLADDAPDVAARAATEALALVAPVSPVRALLAAGAVALAAGDAPAALGRARAAHDTALAQQDRAGLAEALELLAASGPPAQRRGPLAQAADLWQEVGDPVGRARALVALGACTGGEDGLALAEEGRRDLGALGARDLAARAGVVVERLGREPLAPVRVECLGAFRVLVRGALVPRGAWGSRKARDLLKLLVAARGRPVPRDVLVDHLWPGEDPRACGPRLSVALSTLRRVLDPGHALAADALVVADPVALRLDLEAVEVDLELFLRAAARGAGRAGRDVDEEALLDAELLYRGDFCDEDRYEAWGDAVREQARETCAGVLRALADLASQRGDHDGAVRRRLRLLEADPYDERAHLGLVAELVRARRHGEARRAHGRYAARMAELGLPAEPLTTG